MDAECSVFHDKALKHIMHQDEKTLLTFLGGNTYGKNHEMK